MNTEERYDEFIRSLYRLTGFEIKLGLDRVENLVEALGNPHNHFKSIHIGGTNGKGSTAAIIESILQEAGYRTGLFTSPHLVEFTERIKVNGSQITKEEVVAILEKQMPYIRKYDCTFFESATSLAFEYFAEKKVDVAIVEVGMGGRLDATNVLSPLFSVITPIGYEHQKWLGDTLVKIAGEKAGIIKKKSVCISAPQFEEVEDFLRTDCEKKGTIFYSSRNYIDTEIIRSDIYGSVFNYSSQTTHIKNLTIPLSGYHQIENAGTSLFCAEYLNKLGFEITSDNIRAGIEKVRWEARLEVAEEKPLVLFDVAHNFPALEVVFREIRRFYPQKRINLLIGILADKEYQKMVDLISENCHFVGCVKPESERALDPEILCRLITDKGLDTRCFRDTVSGFGYLKSISDVSDILLVSGSHYIIGELKKNLKNLDK